MLRTVWLGLRAYTTEPALSPDGGIAWRDAATESPAPDVLRSVEAPFQPTGGLRVLDGPLGCAVIKTSAKAGRLDGDFVAVVRFQGPKANGMPELHKLMPPLGVLQHRGRRIALVTDGRLSGASGRGPAAIHVTPEALDGGGIAKIREGDVLRVDAVKGRLEVAVGAVEWAARLPAETDLSAARFGVGRELFGAFRAAREVPTPAQRCSEPRQNVGTRNQGCLAMMHVATDVAISPYSLTSAAPQVPPFDFVLFGGAGDLTRRKLLPSLLRLDSAGALPPNTRVLCVGREPFSDLAGDTASCGWNTDPGS